MTIETKEVEATIALRTGWNAKDRRIYWRTSSGIGAGDFVELDVETGEIARTSAWPIGSYDFRSVVYGWDTTYAYGLFLVGKGFGPPDPNAGVRFVRVQQSDFTLFDTHTLAPFSPVNDWSQAGDLTPHCYVSGTGRYVSTVQYLYNNSTFQYEPYLMTHDYQTNTDYQANCSADLGPLGNPNVKGGNCAYDDNDKLWVLNSLSNAFPWDLHRYAPDGTHEAQYSFTPTNPGDYADASGALTFHFDPDTSDLVIVAFGITATDYDAGKTNVWRWNTTSHAIVGEFGRWSKYVDDFGINENFHWTVYVKTSWTDETLLVSNGFSPDLVVGVLNLMDITTGVNVQYPLDAWAAQIPDVEIDYSDYDAFYSPVVWNADSESFVGIAFTNNFPASWIVLASIGVDDPCTDLGGYTDDDLPDGEPAVSAVWPFDDLKPRHVGIFPVFATLGGGVALTRNEEAEDTGAGYWEITLADIPIHSRRQVLKWRETQTLLNGRGGVLLAHIYDGKRAPWLTVGAPIVAEAFGDFLLGTTAGSIKIVSGGVPEAGMHFSAGERLYRLETVGSPGSDPSVYPVTIWPKVRTDFLDGAALEFTHPVCRCRLKGDDGMKLDLKLLKDANPTLELVEDI